MAKDVSTLRHNDRRPNIPTAELESAAPDAVKKPVRVAYERRNADLDPQLVWRGKDMADWSELVVDAPPLYIQEKVHPKAIIDDLMRTAGKRRDPGQPDLFADFNGIGDDSARKEAEFYRHSKHWTNRMILGDSLQAMASLAEREGLRGKVQCVYIDPPYGIRFNSNFQWSTTSTTVKDGNAAHITREPEQVKAFRDTWRDGIHSYLTYLRDRLTVARDLLTDSGSIFVQIGDENVHRVRAVMDEVFGDENFVSDIVFSKTVGQTSEFLPGITDYCLWYAKRRDKLKFRPLLREKEMGGEGTTGYRFFESKAFDWRPLTADEKAGYARVPENGRLVAIGDLSSQRQGRSSGEGSAMSYDVLVDGRSYRPSGARGWSTTRQGMSRLGRAQRIYGSGRAGVGYVRYLDDFSAMPRMNIWTDTVGQSQYGGSKTYVVQTGLKVLERCILMTTDPGDLVLDPTCGSGTTATVAEQWGRRWITIDTSRVALALARARLMGARYPYYLLADSPEGRRKEAEITRTVPPDAPTTGDVRHGFVYARVPHVTLKSIANNAEIDAIWEARQPAVEAARTALNAALAGHAEPFPVTTGGRAGQTVDFRAAGQTVPLPSGETAPRDALLEWEVPREAPASWPEPARTALAAFWEARIARQREIDASIAAKADSEYLYDKPYEDKARVRVAGPFTVESLSPHRALPVDEHGEPIGLNGSAPKTLHEPSDGYRHEGEAPEKDFAGVILENLRRAGVHQAEKGDRIAFTALTGFPGTYICAEGRYREGDAERRAGIFIGPEYGTVQRPDLIAAAKEAGREGFDMLIACAFNYEAHINEFDKVGGIPILKARMNPDLHMGEELKPGGGNLFVVFGEPDLDLIREGDMLRVKINGVDVFKPQTGEIESSGPEGIACWFIDDDYDEASFFVRHAYFLGANDPYKALKISLKAEIDEEAWASLNSDTSRPFPKPSTGRIAVKVINHLGDEVMKVFAVL